MITSKKVSKLREVCSIAPETSFCHEKLSHKLPLIIILTLVAGMVALVLGKLVDLKWAPFIEEPLKAGLILLAIILFNKPSNKVIAGLSIGLVFGLCEAIYYLINAIIISDLNSWLYRLIFITPFHILTAVLMIVFACRRKFNLVYGLEVAIIIHLLFNLAISNGFLTKG